MTTSTSVVRGAGGKLWIVGVWGIVILFVINLLAMIAAVVTLPDQWIVIVAVEPAVIV